MKLETGEPIMDGRYVVYVPGVLGWLEPKLVLWQKGKWTFTFSTEEFPDKVVSWMGPLPVMKFRPEGERTSCPQCSCDIPTKGDTPDDHAPGCPESGPPQEFDL